MQLMSRKKLYILCYVIVLVLIGFLVYRPLPDGFCKTTSDRFLMHIFEPALRVSYYWPSRFFFSTVTGMVWWTRIVLNSLSSLLGVRWAFSWTIRTESAIWEGVPVRLYVPVEKPSTDGAVIFIHGGGFALGNVGMYDSLTRRMASMLNTLVISIEYRLSPETPYPGGLLDCEHAIEYFHRIAKEKYGVDTKKIVIMGDSAGGNLVAVLTQRRKDRGEQQFAGQVLMYPLLQMADLQSLSYRYYQKNMEGFALVDPESVVLYYMFYAGIDMDKHKNLAKVVLTNGHIAPELRSTVKKYLRYDEFSDANYSMEVIPERVKIEEHQELQKMMAPWVTNPDFSPIMKEDLSGLPKAFIMTCEYDVLRDEGIMYAIRLKEAGVPTVLRNYKNGFHAMLNFHYEIEEASNALDDIIQWTGHTLVTAA